MYIEGFLSKMKIFAALTLVTLFCCLKVALGYSHHPVRQQRYYNSWQQDTATAQSELLKCCVFTPGFVFSFMQDLEL